MADNLGGVAAAGAAAAATGTPTTVNGQVATPALAATGAAPATSGAIQSVKPTAGQSPGETKTFDVKVDGQIVKMTEPELLQAASLGKAAFKRMEEANSLKARTDAFWEEFQKDPMAALDNPAIKLSPQQKRQLIEKYYKEKFIDTDAMTPAERENQELKKWKAEKEQEDKDRSQSQETEQKKVLEGQWREHYTKVIIEALDKAKLPKNPKTVGRMAFYIQQNAKNNYGQTMEQIIQRVENDFSEEFQGLGNEAAPETLVKLLGPNAVKKIQKYLLDQHRSRQSAQVGKAPEASTTAEPKKKEPQGTGRDWKRVTNYWTRNDK